MTNQGNTDRKVAKVEVKPEKKSATETMISLIETEHLSFRTAADRAGINKGEAWKIINGDEALQTRYARAREARGHAQGEAVGELGQAVLAGVYPPDVARVALDAMKWSAARMAPKVYGDKVDLTHAGPGGGAIPLSLSVRFVDKSPETRG